MRKRARKDSNHNPLVEFFRAAGASVVDLSPLGSGVPDVLLGYQGQSVLVEFKSGPRAPHTDDQLLFMRCWRGGPVSTIRDIEGAQTLLRALSN